MNECIERKKLSICLQLFPFYDVLKQQQADGAKLFQIGPGESLYYKELLY